MIRLNATCRACPYTYERTYPDKIETRQMLRLARRAGLAHERLRERMTGRRTHAVRSVTVTPVAA